jgi:hypothetical protein
MSEETAPVERAGLTQEHMRDNVIRHAFAGDASRYEAFCEAIRGAVPPDTAAVMRGSAITGVRWNDGAPFDGDGPGTSDLDLTLVGRGILRLYRLEGFFIPGVHTKPLSEKDPGIAPDLVPLRERLMGMVGRPVNIQATTDWIMYLREHLMGQPYLTLFGAVSGP